MISVDLLRRSWLVITYVLVAVLAVLSECLVDDTLEVTRHLR